MEDPGIFGLGKSACLYRHLEKHSVDGIQVRGIRKELIYGHLRKRSN
jgi:hypothetical protein